MSLKDRFDRFIDYFTEDEDSSLPYEKEMSLCLLQ